MSSKIETVNELDAAKALRGVIPHARQIGALRRCIENYESGEMYRNSPAYEQMLDVVAKDLGIALRAEARNTYIRAHWQRYGACTTADDLPEEYRIDAGGRDLEEVLAGLREEEGVLFQLKDKVLYVALRLGYLDFECIGFCDDVLWDGVTFEKRKFLIPVSRQLAERYQYTDFPWLPLEYRGSIPRRPRPRTEALNDKTVLEMYLDIHNKALKEFEKWHESRSENFLKLRDRLN